MVILTTTLAPLQTQSMTMKYNMNVYHNSCINLLSHKDTVPAQLHQPHPGHLPSSHHHFLHSYYHFAVRWQMVWTTYPEKTLSTGTLPQGIYF